MVARRTLKRMYASSELAVWSLSQVSLMLRFVSKGQSDTSNFVEDVKR